MQVKNKLYKHHKNKVVLVLRNLSISFSFIVAVAGLVAIPTYITDKSASAAEAKTVEEKPADSPEEENNLQTEELLTYSEK